MTPLVHLRSLALGILVIFFFFFCFSLLSGCAEVSHGGLIDISLVTNETEHFFMVYWPFVCLNFSFI